MNIFISPIRTKNGHPDKGVPELLGFIGITVGVTQRTLNFPQGKKRINWNLEYSLVVFYLYCNNATYANHQSYHKYSHGKYGQIFK